MLALLTVVFGSASAQSFPSKPIRFVVPVVAGGSPDIFARQIGQRLHAKLGQPVVVENRAGAGQMIGAEYVAKSAADGHTIMVTTGTFTTSAAIRSNLPFDPVNDLTGVAKIAVGPLLLIVHPSLPVKTVRARFAELAPAKTPQPRDQRDSRYG